MSEYPDGPGVAEGTGATRREAEAAAHAAYRAVVKAVGTGSRMVRRIDETSYQGADGWQTAIRYEIRDYGKERG